MQTNSEITARAVKGALRNKLSTLKHHQFEPGEAPLRLKGFRLLRKLASGGTTEVFLAEREADGLPLVLKVLSAAGPPPAPTSRASSRSTRCFRASRIRT